MKIFLIRHGETEGNRLRVVQKPDVPLNDRGLDQASRMAARLREAGIRRILASDYSRAAMTADALSQATRIEIESEPLLRERNFGDLRGQAYATFGFDPNGPDYEPPNGETWAVFHQRIERAWERVKGAARETEGHLAVVTHGLVCHSMALHHLTLEAPLQLPERWGNTSVTEIERSAPHRVTVLNCTSHLDAGAEDDQASRSGL